MPHAVDSRTSHIFCILLTAMNSRKRGEKPFKACFKHLGIRLMTRSMSLPNMFSTLTWKVTHARLPVHSYAGSTLRNCCKKMCAMYILELVVIIKNERADLYMTDRRKDVIWRNLVFYLKHRNRRDGALYSRIKNNQRWSVDALVIRGPRGREDLVRRVLCEASVLPNVWAPPQPRGANTWLVRCSMHWGRWFPAVGWNTTARAAASSSNWRKQSQLRLLPLCNENVLQRRRACPSWGEQHGLQRMQPCTNKMFAGMEGLEATMCMACRRISPICRSSTP